MLNPCNLPAFALQLPLAEAGQLLLVVAIAFAIITLIASTYRFHQMIDLNEKDLTTVENCNDYFFINVTRYLSKINRVSSGFGVVTIQFQSEESELRATQEDLLKLANQLIRTEYDKACLFRENCIAVILDTEEERAAEAAERLMKELCKARSAVPAITAFRAGVSIFPMHGLTSQSLIDAATDAMEQASFNDHTPLRIAVSETEPEEKPDEKPVGQLAKQDKNSSIDPLTGVLKPEVIGSYMRKYLADIRLKKNPAAVLCVGINRLDNIISLHSEDAADSIIAGVSDILQKYTRDSDLIGRYHRSDFIILAPCSLEQGELIAIRLREAVQKMTLPFEEKQLKTSISVGISAHPEHGRALRHLFQGAHAALDVIRGWNTSSCLVYDPEKHNEKEVHETASKTRG